MRSYLSLALIALSITACDVRVNWPSVVDCSTAPATDLVRSVYTVLAGHGSVRDELEALARKHGASTILCIVQTFAHGTMAGPSKPSDVELRVQYRATKFLDEVGH